MKSIILTVCIISLCWSCAMSQPHVVVSWQANSESDLANYKIYYGQESRVYDNVKIVAKSKNTEQIYGLIDSTAYFFALTASDIVGNESIYSNEVEIFYTIKLDTIDTTSPAVPFLIEIRGNGEVNVNIKK